MTNGEQSLHPDSQKQRSRLGEWFLRAFYRLVHTVKIHQDNNQLLAECAREFVGSLARWLEDEDRLTIRISHGRFYLQDEKLGYRRENTGLVQGMLRYFEERGLTGLCFYPTVKDSSFGQILNFTRLLNSAVHQEDPVTWLSEKLQDDSFPWVEILYGPESKPQEHDIEKKEMARRTYTYALASVKEVSQKINSHGRAGVRKIKRTIQNMVDLLAEDESVVMWMSTIRDYDDYTYAHSVNVAILSLCLGKRIGLSRLSLGRLGICALVHDLGKLEVPLAILNKPGTLSDREFREIKKHPLWSVSQIIKLRTSRELRASILLPPLEHHMKYDLSGYPRVRGKKCVSLFGRIVAIADVFDAITSPRIYRPYALSPDRALGRMLEGAGKDFDPILLKVFINMLGIYPIGTLLLLDTGELGLVMDSLEDGDRSRPQVLLLVSDGQGGFKKGKNVNLGERNPKTGSFMRNIDRSLHPSTYGIQPAVFLL